MTVIDIETAGLPMEQLQGLKPQFEAPSNYTDKDKIAAHIAKQEQQWLDRAALDATSGKVLVIGVLENDCTFLDGGGDEIAMLIAFWAFLDQKLSNTQVIGFCVFNFDLPFLIRRSAIHGVKVPWRIRSPYRGRYYWHENLVDLADLWQCGNRDQTISLDRLAKVLGVGAKSGTGADFAGLWESDRAAALDYLKMDLELTRKCYERMT